MSGLFRSPRTAGELVRRTRLERGWTQDELAGRMRVRQATVSKLEAGKPATRIDILFRALAALGLQLPAGPRETPADIEDFC